MAGDIEYRLYRAEQLLGENRKAEAIAMWREVSVLRPDDHRSWLNLCLNDTGSEKLQACTQFLATARNDDSLSAWRQFARDALTNAGLTPPPSNDSVTDDPHGTSERIINDSNRGQKRTNWLLGTFLSA
jgi:hypothetical protein